MFAHRYHRLRFFAAQEKIGTERVTAVNVLRRHSGFKNGLEEPSKFSSFPRKDSQTIRSPPVGAPAVRPASGVFWAVEVRRTSAPRRREGPALVLIGSTPWLGLVRSIIFKKRLNKIFKIS